MRALAWVLIVTMGGATAACGGGSSSGNSDASASAADAATDGGHIAMPPAVPDLGTCPDSWTETTSAGVRVCEPWPSSGPLDCVDGDAQWLGADACAPVGTNCPADGWPADLPADIAIWYVRAGAAAGGDGTQARPFASVMQATQAAYTAGGGTVAVAVGRYDEHFAIPRDTTVWGACPAQTILTSSAVDMPYAVVQASTGEPGAVLRNVTIRGGSQPGILVGRMGSELLVQDVAIEGVSGAGLYTAQGGHLVADHVVVRDTRPGRFIDMVGYGAFLRFGSSAELRSCVFERNHVSGIAVLEGSSVTVRASVVRLGQPDATSGDNGFGLWVVDDGSSADVGASLFEANRLAGLAVQDASELVAEDVVVRGTRSDDVDPNRGGRALLAQTGSTVTVRRARFEGSEGVAVDLQPGPLTATIEDVVVVGTQAEEDGLGYPFNVREGASLVLTRAVVQDAYGVAFNVGLAGTRATLSDVVIRDVHAYERGAFTGKGGSALWAHTSADVSIERARIENVRVVGIAVHASATVRLTDVVVRDVESSALDGRLGYGLETNTGGSITASRVEIERARGIGVVTFGGEVHLADVVVTDTRLLGCATDACTDAAFGIGISAFGGSIDARNFRVHGAPLCGVHVAPGGSLDLASGSVTGCGIGACVQVDGYEVSRLSNDVVYSDNGRTLDSVVLPAPTPVPPLPGET